MTDLGLSMIHGLAKQLGGALTLLSEVERGSEIQLWLLVREEAIEISKTTETTQETSQRGRVLLVDDEVLIRSSTAEMLSEFGFELVEASSAEHALEQVGGGFVLDILVTDHPMPRMTGIELARALAEQHLDLLTLVVSGYAEGDGIARLTKPLSR